MPLQTESINQKQQQKQKRPPKITHKKPPKSPSEPKITFAAVEKQLFKLAEKLPINSVSSQTTKWARAMKKTTENYKKGLFLTIEIEDLPRTNNTAGRKI